MTPQPPQPAPSDAFGARIDDLASAIEQRPPLEVEKGPRTRTNRHVYWLIGTACALTIGVAEVGILVHGTPDLPVTSSAVVAAYEKDPCASRMTAILDAIDAYTSRQGTPPPALAALYPGYLMFEPVDPVTKEAYGYSVTGDAVALTCPSGAERPGSATAPHT